MDGRRIPLTPGRRLAVDFLHFAAGVPTVPVQRRMDLRAVVRARGQLSSRPSWTAIFTKAYGRVSDDLPELRRAYVKFPRPHLVEYPSPVAAITVERDMGGERMVLIGRVRYPGEFPLPDLTARLREYSEAPVGEVKDFRRELRMARWPGPVRRLALWLGLNSGRRRARHFGTFGVSVYSALGAESLHPLAPFTTLLNYGVIGPDGGVDVRLVYDHRVLDGATVARALAHLEEVLTGPILWELEGLAAGAATKEAPAPQGVGPEPEPQAAAPKGR